MLTFTTALQFPRSVSPSSFKTYETTHYLEKSVFLAVLCSLWDLSPRMGTELGSQQRECQAPATVPPGDSLQKSWMSSSSPHMKRFFAGTSGKGSACQWKRHGFDPWVGMNLWRREWLPTPVFLLGKFRG